MADRQLLAKCGVVVLLGLNVGAYYLFWPKNNGCPTEHSERTPQSAPAAPMPPVPQNFPATAAKNAAPVSVPSGPVENDKPMETDAVVSRLLELIQKDSVQPIPVVGARDAVPIPPPIPAEKPSDLPPSVPGSNPRTLPPLKSEPLKVEANADPNAALAQQNQAGPWLVAVQKSGTQSLVTAKLRATLPARLPVEFVILCDRVDASGADSLEAFGNVTFVGAGIKGRCQRLTIPRSSAHLVFVEQVRITPDNALAGSQLCGERFVWEQPANGVDLNAVEFRPAGVLVPNMPTPSVLGTPK